MAPEENINDLLSAKIFKEDVPDGHAEPMDKNELIGLLKKEECMCKIKYNKLKDNEIKNCTVSGFFLEMNISGIPFNKFLMTNNHVIDRDFMQINKEIIIEYNNAIKLIQYSIEEYILVIHVGLKIWIIVFILIFPNFLRKKLKI